MSDIIKAQQGLARKAETDRTHHFEDLYHLLCKREWIEEALQHVLDNDGSQTAGIDGISWKTFNDVDKDDFENEKFKQQFIDTLQAELKNRTFKPMPVRRVEIAKPGTNKKRPLGIPMLRSYCPPYRVLSGFRCRCESAELTHAASTVPYFPRVDESPVVSNGAESACAALR
jgi:hypothetical protein